LGTLNFFNHSDEDISGGGGEHGGWIDFTAPSRMKEDMTATCVLNIVFQKRLSTLYIWIRACTWRTIDLIVKEYMIQLLLPNPNAV
jgi:hypothetical protein